MNLIKNLVILTIVVGALYVGYRLFFSTETDLVIDSGFNEGEMIASEFLMRLNEINTINFSRDFFEDPRFRSLVSFSSTPGLVSAGRANPFSR